MPAGLSPCADAVCLLQEQYKDSNLLLAGLSTDGTLPSQIVEQFVTGALPRAAGSAVVDDWDCLRVSALFLALPT